MNKEQKDLLLKDLCARLPYGVKFACNKNIYTAKGLDLIVTDEGGWEYAVTAKGIAPIEIDFIKPYLFPLSSMTDEQEEEFKNLFYRFHESAFIFNERFAYDRYSIKDIGFYPCYLQDWLLKNNFDIYGLIPMGIAIDATGKNIY